ncbi:uroporphyrinogen decarboxylase family protein [Paludicola sp. MB14-C6]|uniref:uroporphyrinogen decarboxylase family protein n=1 Tax=Paludihabitans sp. MB14-C6 TaxID=3070656 RepID=UPI0027DC5904|nr:uroporphyrinogen decarboxylase family protein [Paludicola sp. MB14-C6]WMJ22744.1 uroporphyrinogen decarboxylase family protein [Paludicola sp. MB14-C6]
MRFSEMSGRERIIAALQSKEVDRLPWAPLIDDYFINSLPAQNYNYNFIEACRYIGNDVIKRHVAEPLVKNNNVERRIENKGNCSIEYFETPVGSLKIERKRSGNTTYISKHMVETLDDIKVFQYICENTEYIPLIEQFIEEDKMIGDMGIASVDGQMSPIQELLQFISGVENTVYLLMDYPDEIEELFSAMHERNKRQYNTIFQYPCDFIFDYEDTSTTVMSRNMFEEYSLPAINDYSDWVHSQNKIFITHMCGKLSGLSDLIAKGRQDGIDSVCPPQTGDFYPWDARNAWGCKRVIGGIDPPSLVLKSQPQIMEIVSQILQQVTNKQGFILSTGDAVPFGTPINLLKDITDLIKGLGPKSLL